MQKETIYIKLLNEGTIVFRPVVAILQKENIYKLEEGDFYDSEDETWEFLPGSFVKVEKHFLGNQQVLIAVQEV